MPTTDHPPDCQPDQRATRPAVDEVAVIIPAAGRGERLGPGGPKALRELGGEPLLVHAVRSLHGSGLIGATVVAAPAGRMDEVRALLTPVLPTDHPLTVVAGGASRRASVAAGLAALPDSVRIVLVHDAARPLVPAAVVRRVVTAVREGAPAVVPALPVADTIKRTSGDTVVGTVDRTDLVAVQTPQGFDRATLLRAHEQTVRDATDDAGMVEELGLPVRVVEGSEAARKVTRPFDLLIAEAVLTNR